MALKPTRARRSKVEIEQEFATLVEQTASEKTGYSAKNELLSQMQETEVRAAVSEITVEIIAKKLSDLNVEISRNLSGISEKMNAEVGLLHSLKEAVALESKDLRRLHGIDIAATSIDQLLTDYQEKKASFEADLLKARQEWAREAEEKKKEESEYAENLKKIRARELDIAVKAIEGASGAKALSQINQIAMEQAKNRMPN